MFTRLFLWTLSGILLAFPAMADPGTLAVIGAVGAAASGAAAIGGLLSGGKGPSPSGAIPPPSVDAATVAAQQEEQQSQDANKKKGALSTLLNTGNTSTGATLGAGSPETTLKRFLGN